MRTICIVVEYEGTRYSGWQVQPGVVTIQQVIEEAVEKLTGYGSRLHVAGRTDAGVHALAQLASFETASEIECSHIRDGLNHLLPDDIAVLHAFEVASGFRPRKAARGKIYRYLIWNRPARPAVLRNFAWHVRSPLDVGSMRKGLKHFVGRHDFSAFTKSDHEGGVVHVVTRADVEGHAGELVSFEFEGTGFAKHQVRAMVGTLVEVGLKKRRPDEIASIIDSRDRRLAGRTAPARGLFLVRVLFDPPLAGYEDATTSLTDIEDKG